MPFPTALSNCLGASQPVAIFNGLNLESSAHKAEVLDVFGDSFSHFETWGSFQKRSTPRDSANLPRDRSTCYRRRP